MKRSLEKLREWQRRSAERYEKRRKRKRIKARNQKRWARRYERNFGKHAAWVRTLPCDTCGAPPPSDPSHARSRGAGGDKRELVPQCRGCHVAYHAGAGPSLEEARARAAHYWSISPHGGEK